MDASLQRRAIGTQFTPRWTFGSVVTAGAVTLGLYLLLPYLERLSAPPAATLSLRRVDAVDLPPPPPPPPRAAERKPPPAKPKTPKPEMQAMQRRLEPLRAAFNFGVAMDAAGGDFSMDFDVQSPVLEEQVRDLVFELADLDEPPRPLARLAPIYPPQARMRRIEGSVHLEFVVAADGTARDVRVTSAQPSDVFNEAAVRAVQMWRFSPGTREGKPVAVRVRQKVDFALN